MIPEADGSACAAADGVHGDLGWALATVLRAYARAADQALADLPGGPRGYRLLAAVVRECPRSQLALAQHVGLDRTVVTYLLDDLAAAGLVERRPDPADRRTRRIVPTPAGTARTAAIEVTLGQVEAHVLGALDGGEGTQLRGLLQRVALALRDDQPVAATESACLAAAVALTD